MPLCFFHRPSRSSSDEEIEQQEAARTPAAEYDPTNVSLIDGLLSLIPGTDAYKRAAAAQAILDNVDGMKAEIVRSGEIMKLIDEGLFENALKETKNDLLGADPTKYLDYGRYNKFLGTAKESGEWRWAPPKHMQRKVKLSKKDQHKADIMKKWKLCQRALAGEHMIADTEEVSAHLNIVLKGATGTYGSSAAKSDQCTWRKDDAEGQLYLCGNSKFVHPTRKVMDALGVEVKEISKCCAWHVRDCTGEHGGKHVRISIPNEDALCATCYLTKHGRQPNGRVTPFTVPGVRRDFSNAAGGGGGKMGAGTKSGGGDEKSPRQELTEFSICSWVPNREVSRERGLTCINVVFRNPETRALCPTCAWHVPKCVHPSHVKDTDDRPSRILIKNEHGLCIAHHVAKFKKPPEEKEFPYPGMVLKHQAVEVVGIQSHWAAPSMEPAPKHRHQPRFVPRRELRKRKSCVQKATCHGCRTSLVLYFKKKAGFATIFVLTIQKLVRGHLGRVELNRRKLLRSATIRATAVVIIQSLGRGYVARSRTQKVVQEKEKSVGSVNFLLLRWIGRHRRRKHRAKKVMGRLSIRLLAKIKAKMTHMVHAARAHVENTEQGSDLLTRVARGYLGRCKVRARKRDLAKRFWAAQQIQKIIRGHLCQIEVAELVEVTQGNFDAVAYIQRLWRKRMAMRTTGRWMKEARIRIKDIQRLARGFLGRCRARREREIVEEAWAWINPTQPRSAFDFFLLKTQYTVNKEVSVFENLGAGASSMDAMIVAMEKKKAEQAAKKAEGSVGPEGTAVSAVIHKQNRGWIFDWSQMNCFREYDPDEIGTMTKQYFVLALRKFFKNNNSVLSQREIDAMVIEFDADKTGQIDYVTFMSFAAKQRFPCQKHRRFVCIDCVDYGICFRLGCGCHEFTARAGRGSGLICTCTHSKMSHEMKPAKNTDNDILDANQVSETQLDVIMEGRVSDISKPLFIKGMDIELVKDSKPAQNERIGWETGKNARSQRLARERMEAREVKKRLKEQGETSAARSERERKDSLQSIESAVTTSSANSKSASFAANTSSLGSGNEDVNALATTNATAAEESKATMTMAKASKKDEFLAKQKKEPTGAKPPPIGSILVPRKPVSEGKEPWEDLIDKAKMTPLIQTSKQMASVESSAVNKHEMMLGTAKLTKNVQGMSMQELDRGFSITVPVPVVVNGEIRCTLNASDLYLYLLLNLGNSQLKLIENERAFAEVCYRYNVFMERHWKKLVIDVRTGLLNRHLKISKEKRQTIETKLLPSPARAEMLDKALKGLGFHARAVNLLGTVKTEGADKGLVVKSRSEKKVGPGITVEQATQEVDFDEAPKSARTLRHLNRPRSPPEAGPGGADAPGNRGGPGSSLRRASSPHRANKTGAVLSAEPGISVRSYFDRAKKEAEKGTEKELAKMKEALRTTTPGMFDVDRSITKGVVIRRSSHADLPDLTKQEELNRMSHAMRILPTIGSDEVLIQNQRNKLRFVCSHPGCGKAFTQYEIAVKHEKEHKQRQRLAIPTPAADQYLRSVWPADVPWQDKDQMAIHLKAADPFSCPIPTCVFSATSQDSLAHHLRTRHSKFELQDLLGNTDAHVENQGSYVMVPPFACPKYAKFPVCPYHYRNKIRCPMCEDVKKYAASDNHGPIPPVKLYKQLKVMVPQPECPDEVVARVWKIENSERVPFIIDLETGAIVLCQLWAICEDSTGRRCVGVSKMWDYAALKAIKFDFSKLGSGNAGQSFDKENEVLQDEVTHYIDSTDIMGFGYALNVDRTGFTQKQMTESLPTSCDRSLVKFSRFQFNSQTKRLVGKRLVVPAAGPVF